MYPSGAYCNIRRSLATSTSDLGRSSSLSESGTGFIASSGVVMFGTRWSRDRENFTSSMDNRRVFKAYKERTSKVTKPKGGLLLKMKHLLNPLWSSRVTESLQPEQPENSLQQNSSQPEAHANDVLLTFFQAKGDQPLSEVEYEGVKTLLEKARNESFNRSLDVGSLDTDDANQTVIRTEQPNIVVTPYNTTLKTGNDLVLLSTPEYKPAYHSVERSSSRSIPSVKRVYLFSGLPSPYRTRIKPPSAKKQSLRILPSSDSQPLDLSSSFTTKPTSKAATTLLEILDKAEPSDNLKKFANPYSTSIKRGVIDAPSPSKRKHVATADDIHKTISFSQAREIPENNTELFARPGEEKGNEEEKVTKEEKPEKEAKPEKETKPEKEAKSAPGKVEAPFFKTETPALFKAAEAPKPAPSTQAEPPTFSTQAEAPASTQAEALGRTQPASKPAKQPPSFTNGTAEPAVEFVFPHVTPTPVSLDPGLVEKYKGQYIF